MAKDIVQALVNACEFMVLQCDAEYDAQGKHEWQMHAATARLLRDEVHKIPRTFQTAYAAGAALERARCYVRHGAWSWWSRKWRRLGNPDR